MDAGYLALRSCWRKMVTSAIKAKKPFQDDADEISAYFDGPYDFLYGEGRGKNNVQFRGKRSSLPKPPICVTVNKVSEGVQLFGPALYHRNPVCTVTPRQQPEIPLEALVNPQDQQSMMMGEMLLQEIKARAGVDAIRSSLMSGFLNYLPTAINLKDSSRNAIDETIIKGMGVLWAVMDNPAGGRKTPVLEYDTVDNLIIDPDHERREDARWIARRFVKPTWEVEVTHGLERGTIKGNASSTSMQDALDTEGKNKLEGKTSDLLEYWGIWSKMGVGGLLKGVSDEAAKLDKYGQFVYMEVCDGYDYLLNVPKEIWDNDEEVRRRLQWETPFWADVPCSNGWPFTPFEFHRRPRNIWPMSHFRPAIGHLQFMNWATSFLISGIQKRSRDFIAYTKGVGEEIKKKIESGDDLTFLGVESSLGDSIDKIIGFLRHPEFHKDIMPIIQWQQSEFEKATGLNELMYGMQQSQDRSATESKIKENFVNVRPDDMGNKVEDSMTDAFRKLALMSRWHMTGEDISILYGKGIGQLWQQFVATADVDAIIHQLEYRIEAGSTRKPNKNRDREAANELMVQLFPVLSQYAMNTGQVDQVNALLTFWGKSLDYDVSEMLLPQPPPPDPNPPPAPEEVEMAMDEEKHKQDIRHSEEKHKVQMKQAKAKAASNGKARSNK